MTPSYRVLLILGLACLPASLSVAQETAPETVDTAPAPPGFDLFVSKCSSCHTVGQGPRVGPDLAGVHQRRDPGWLKRMIQEPSRMLDSDPDVRRLVAEFNGVRMPDLGLDDAQVQQLLELLQHCSANPCDLTPKLRPVTEASIDDVNLGRSMFLGVTRLANGAPPCVSCHTADGARALMGGGTLSKDLTHAFARYGDEGLDAALRNPGFPVMNKVFERSPMTPEEAFALRAFLYETNRGTTLEDRSSIPLSVPLTALLAAITALIVLNAVWPRRLKGVRQRLLSERKSS